MENKLNLPPFYIGQKVVCIGGKGVLKIGKHYIVSGVFNTCCGYCITIGIMATKAPLVCNICDKKVNEVNGEWFFSPEFFKPLEEINAPLLTFQQIKEVEKEEVLILN